MTKHPYKFTVIHGESGSHGLIMADGPIQVAKLVEGTPADGLIMAAAPAMFEALKEIKAALEDARTDQGCTSEHCSGTCHYCANIRYARAALAQAQGDG
jgi:hypothetical protein